MSDRRCAERDVIENKGCKNKNAWVALVVNGGYCLVDNFSKSNVDI